MLFVVSCVIYKQSRFYRFLSELCTCFLLMLCRVRQDSQRGAEQQRREAAVPGPRPVSCCGACRLLWVFCSPSNLILRRIVTTKGCEISLNAFSASADTSSWVSLCGLLTWWSVHVELPGASPSGSWPLPSHVAEFLVLPCFVEGLRRCACVASRPVASLSCTSGSGARRCWPHAGCGLPPLSPLLPTRSCMFRARAAPLPLLLVECFLECSPFSEG